MTTRSRPAANPFGAVKEGLPRELVYVQASDGALSSGVLLRPEGSASKICAYFMHPRGACSRHYLGPLLYTRGIAFFGHDSRYINNDMDCLHELLLLDIAAGLRRLRELGFDQIVLVDNSGVGSLFSYYQAQAAAPEARFPTSPTADRVDLPAEGMPEAAPFVSLASHLGEGHVLQGMLDPSVVDQHDPDSYDADLDMCNPANGHKCWPEASRYDPAWVVRYREAQEAQAHRIDALARECVDERQTMAALASGPALDGLDPAQQIRIQRRAQFHRFLTIYRTVANPAYLDPSIDVSAPPLGTIFAPGDPMLSNWGVGGLARVMTPRGWLSTWSGYSSRAAFLDTIVDVTLPTLILAADGDTDIYPAQQQQLLSASGAADKRLE